MGLLYCPIYVLVLTGRRFRQDFILNVYYVSYYMTIEGQKCVQRSIKNRDRKGLEISFFYKWKSSRVFFGIRHPWFIIETSVCLLYSYPCLRQINPSLLAFVSNFERKKGKKRNYVEKKNLLEVYVDWAYVAKCFWSVVHSSFWNIKIWLLFLFFFRVAIFSSLPGRSICKTTSQL